MRGSPFVVTVASENVTNYSEHYYQLQPLGAAISEITPAQAIGKRVLDSDRPIIVVATMGGGIQAAAWTDQLEQFAASHDGLIVVESIQLLPDAVAVRVARQVDDPRARAPGDGLA